ncbi:hypothetical protein EK21DRAFT_91952 [Setomelanomma holmii]|uniref:Uncharacterized protein n=1 Tax=Setomelanomma holmii TaxID=210430 RepID=A0A9P4LIU6_9PLEO|nr:hypothetical protein EK21DRAFT_91952 [Setomelanomma holmii]
MAALADQHKFHGTCFVAHQLRTDSTAVPETAAMYYVTRLDRTRKHAHLHLVFRGSVDFITEEGLLVGPDSYRPNLFAFEPVDEDAEISIVYDTIPGLAMLKKGFDIADYRKRFTAQRNLRDLILIWCSVWLILLLVGIFTTSKHGRRIFVPIWFTVGGPVFVAMFYGFGLLIRSWMEWQRVRRHRLDRSLAQGV